MAELEKKMLEVPEEVLALGREREAARLAKDWKKSDALRDLIVQKDLRWKIRRKGRKFGSRVLSLVFDNKFLEVYVCFGARSPLCAFNLDLELT